MSAYGCKAVVAFIGDDDRGGLVCFENGRVFDDIADHGPLGSGRAYNDQRFGGEVDMLFIFNEIG